MFNLFSLWRAATWEPRIDSAETENGQQKALSGSVEVYDLAR